MARTAAEQANHDLVTEMYHQVLIAMDSSAVDRYISPDYIQHSMLAPPGVDALKAFLDDVRAGSPNARQTIHRSFAEGDDDNEDRVRPSSIEMMERRGRPRQ